METPVPIPAAVIGVENASNVTELARWMRGWAVEAAFNPDGTLLAVASEIAIHFYDAESLALIRVIDLPSKYNEESNDPYIFACGFNGIAFSPDGTTLASVVPNAVVLWDVDTGRKVDEFRMDRGSKGSLAFSPDGKQIAAGSFDEVVIWNIPTGKATSLDPGISNSYELAFSPDGNLLAAGSSEGEIAVWNFAEHDIRSLLGKKHDSWVMDLVFSPDGKTLASASRDTTIKLWDTSSWEKIDTLISHEAEVASIAFSPDGKALASGSWDGTMKIWDASTGRVRFTRKLAPQTMVAGPKGSVLSVAFSPDGDTLVSATENFTIQFWNPADGSEQGALGGPPSEVVYRVAVSLDGRTLAVDSTASLQLFDATTGKERYPLKISGEEGRIRYGAFLPNGKILLAAKAYEKPFSIYVMDVESGEVLRHLDMGSFEFNGLAFSPDGKILAASKWGETIGLWDTATGGLIRQWPDGGYNDGTMVFSPDGRILASQRVIDEKWTVTLWDTATGKALHTLEGFSAPVGGKAFSPDGKWFATGSYESVILWDVASGEMKFDLDIAEWADAISLSFSPDGKILAAGSDAIFLWDVNTGEALCTLEGHLLDVVSPSVNSVAFSPDGKFLYSGSLDGTIRIWGVPPSGF